MDVTKAQSRIQTRAKSPDLPQRKNLTPAQAERRRSALSAARALATEGGFDAVSISAVSEKAGLSRATLYHYFGSKAQLLAELTLEVTGDLTASLDFEELAGASAEKRVGAMLERIVDWALGKPKLFEALASGWTTPDIDHPTIQRSFNQRMHANVVASLGTANVENTAEIATVLGHIVFSCLVRINTGIASRDEAKSDMRLAAKLLLKTG